MKFMLFLFHSTFILFFISFYFYFIFLFHSIFILYFYFNLFIFYLHLFISTLPPGLQYGSEEVERILDLTFQYLEDGVEEGIIKSKLNNDNSDEQKEEIDIEGRISLPCPILFCSVLFRSVLNSTLNLPTSPTHSLTHSLTQLTHSTPHTQTPTHPTSLPPFTHPSHPVQYISSRGLSVCIALTLSLSLSLSHFLSFYQF